MIYVKQDNTNKWRVKDFTFNDPQMGIRTINLTVNHPVDWIDGDAPEKAVFTDAYVKYEGERYDITNPKPTAEKDISGLSYKYTLVFEGAESELGRRKIRNLAQSGVDSFVSQGTNFSIYADINQFVQLLNNNLKYYFGNKWTINLGVPSSDDVNITINNMFVWDLLLKTYEYYGVRFFIRGNTINIGQDPDYIDHIFDYGAEGGLVKITRTAQSDPIINRLAGMGSSRNVPVNYFTNRHGKFPADPNPISGDVNIKNIMPKSFRDSVKLGTLPYKDYVEDASLILLSGVHEDALEPNEDIYPSIAGVEVAGLGRIDQIIAAEAATTGDPDDEDYTQTFNIWVKDIGFDLKEDIYTSTDQAKISFTSGLLTGYEFVILATGGKRAVEIDTSKSHNGVSSKYKITLIKSDEELKASGVMLPHQGLNASPGDSFVIYDIEMPQSYVELAEQRVEDWLNAMLGELKVENPTFTVEPMDMFFEDDAPESDGKTIKQKLKSGNKLSINNTKITDGIQELFINSVNIQYGGLLPKYTFTVTDKVQVQGSAVNRLQSEIDAIMARQNLTQLEINSILKDVSRKYLSKLSPDTAKEVITFLKGIIANGTSHFANLIASGKITTADFESGTAEVTDTLTAKDIISDTLQTQILHSLVTATLQDVILKGQLNSETFTSGFLGSGFRLNKIGDRWILELDEIIVRKSMQIYELIVQRIRYQGGQVIHSPAGGKITKVTNGGTYWRIEHDSPDDFITNDQVQCQNFKVGSAAQNPDGSTTFDGVSVKRYWRLVTSYGKGWFNLSKTDMEAGSAEPEVGDDIVVLGNRTDPTRQNAYMIVSTGANSPYTAHLSGINSYSTAGKEVVREGNLSGIVDADFGQLSGFGLYAQNVFLKGIFRLTNGQLITDFVEDKITLAVADKVDKGNILASINLSEEGVKISGEKVQFTGSVSFQSASQSVAQEVVDTAVNNLQIGDVNLARYSGTGYYLNSAGVLSGIYSDDRSKSSVVTEGGVSAVRVQGGGILRIASVKGLTAGKTYTWRIMIKGTTDLTGLFQHYAGSGYGSTNVTITEDWAVYTNTFVCQGTYEILHIYSLSDTFYIADWMLVEGNKVTEGWSANILDVEAKINAAKQEALTAAGNAQSSANAAQTAVDNLDDYMGGAFRDGVIDAAEAKAIEKSINILNSTMSEAEASYNKVYANTYLEGTAKTNLLNAKINLWGQRDTLLSAINTAISGGSTTPAQKTAYDNAFATFNNLMLAFQNAIEEANKAIQVKLDQLSTDRVNNLQVGGRNYFPISKLVVYSAYATVKEKGTDYFEITKVGSTELVAIGLPTDYIAANLNKRIIITGYFYINGQPVTTSGGTLTTYRTSLFYSINSATGFIKNILSPNTSQWLIHTNFRRDGIAMVPGDVLRVEKLMVEVVESGNLSSDHRIADEDVQAGVDNAATIAADAQAKANTSKAITDKFKTTINGGLINTVITEFREADSEQVTGLISGIQGANKDLPFLVAGGTYAEGIAGTAKAIIRHDGTVKFTEAEIVGTIYATDGEFSGKITSTTGAIGGFEISSGRIGKAQSGDNPTNNGMSLYDDFIKFSNANASVFLGTNVLPSSSGITAMMRLKDRSTVYGSKYGMILDVFGATANNTAIDLVAGHISGLSMRTRQISSTATLTRADVVVTCYFSNDSQYVYMPSSPEVGEFKVVFNINARSVNMRGNGKNFKAGHGGSEYANFEFGPSHTIKNNCMFIWDGQYWIIMTI